MIDPSQLEPLRERKAQIEKRMADLDNRAAKIARERVGLADEALDIDTTLSTLAKIYGIELPEAPAIKAGKSTGGTSTKPDSAPTLFEMVKAILDDEFLDWALEGQYIYDEIKRRWWPDAPRNSIFPSLWRFANEGRLVKDGTRYGLPRDEAPGASTPSASWPEGDIDDEIPF